MFRLVGVLAAIVALVAAEDARTARAEETLPLDVRATAARLPVLTGNPQGADQPAVFVTLPLTKGFADATHALVETKQAVHDALHARNAVRLVDHAEDSDAVLTVLGRGTGHAELTVALQLVDPSVVSSPVTISSNERFIEAMLTVGSCADAATSVSTRSTSPACYRKIFVGLCVIDRNVRQTQSVASNSWNACATALVKDVQAWFGQNASRLFVFPR